VNHADHVNLLRDGVPGPGGLWADLGAGTGAFTLALADLIGPTGQIYAMDKDRSVLRRLEQAMHARFPATTVHCRVGNFTKRLDLPSLDGVVMANSLHFQRKKEAAVQ
jgi:precorrin-6B methylase 2